MLGQGIELGFEGQDVETLDRAGSVDAPGDGRRTSSHLLPGRGEAEQGAALIAGVTGLSQQAVVNQAFDERSQGATVEVEAGGQLFHTEAIGVLPHDQHDQVLGVGEAQLPQVLLVGAGDGPAGAVEGEAELVVEGETAVLVHSTQYRLWASS